MLTIGYAKDFIINDTMIVAPAEQMLKCEVVRGPNIKPFPEEELR